MSWRARSTRGRFGVGCVPGCVGRVEQRSSGVETAAFSVLSLMFAGMRSDVPFPGDQRRRLDMLVAFPSGYRLGVEYDGAYWHQGRERQDCDKADRFIADCVVHDVLRVREEPLPLFGQVDLPVRRGAPGIDVAQLVLLHVAHALPPGAIDPFAYEDRLIALWRAIERPPTADHLRCLRCADVLDAVTLRR